MKKAEINGFEYMLKKEKGVTLIALIITILVLLILAGVVMNTVIGEDGLLKKASDASDANKKAEIKEELELYLGELKIQSLLDGQKFDTEYVKNKLIEKYPELGITIEGTEIKIKENGEEIATIDDKFKVIVEGIPVKSEYQLIADMFDPAGTDISKIKVGDYIAYTPNTVTLSNGEGIIKDLTDYSGNWGDPDYNKTDSTNPIRQETVNWRVLDKIDGKIILISEKPVIVTALEGTKGYNNAVFLLNELCKTLYSKTGTGIARSINIEDIERYTTYNYNLYTSNAGVQYGSEGNTISSNAFYPIIWANEIGSTINGSATGGTLGLSTQTRADLEWGKNIASSIKATQTNWTKEYTSANASTEWKNPIYYKLLINSGTGGYIDNYAYNIASRCVEISNEYGPYMVSFGIRQVFSGKVTYEYLGGQAGYNDGNVTIWLKCRPIVTLESNVKLNAEAEGKDGTTPTKAWEIK